VTEGTGPVGRHVSRREPGPGRARRLVDVVSFTLPDNLTSRRVMEKLGFTFERDTRHAGLPHVLYRRFSASSARSTSRSVV